MEQIDEFTRLRPLFGPEFSLLRGSNVLVCGIGGVGGVCIDALFRSGVRNITAVDYDEFDITNQNRQLHSKRVGELKTDVFREIYGICCVNSRLDEGQIKKLNLAEFDVVIDAIDEIPAKVALAHSCGDKLISSMGAAKRIDPLKIKVASVWDTSIDPFARKFRHELKKSGFTGDFPVVFSSEKPRCTQLGSFVAVSAAVGLNLAALCVRKIIGEI